MPNLFSVVPVTAASRKLGADDVLVTAAEIVAAVEEYWKMLSSPPVVVWAKPAKEAELPPRVTAPASLPMSRPPAARVLIPVRVRVVVPAALKRSVLVRKADGLAVAVTSVLRPVP